MVVLCLAVLAAVGGLVLVFLRLAAARATRLWAVLTHATSSLMTPTLCLRGRRAPVSALLVVRC